MTGHPAIDLLISTNESSDPGNPVVLGMALAIAFGSIALYLARRGKG